MNVPYKYHAPYQPPLGATRVAYPLSHYRPVRMGTCEKVASLFFLLTMLCLFAAGAYLLVAVFGYDALAQLHGTDRVVDAFDLAPPSVR